MALSIAPLFSGSKGNSILIGTEETKVLIDAGYSCKKIEQELQKVQENLGNVSAILVTHEHSDHICGIGIISRKYDIPIYANEPTWQSMINKIGNVAEKNIRTIGLDDFYVGNLCVQPYEISHDAAWPFGYSVCCEGKKISVMTDTGKVSKSLLEQVRNANIVLLESNHDVEMLKCGPYPYNLKRRILSTKGHLSNEDAASVALSLAECGVRGILLGHLSENNNFYELAYKTVTTHLEQNGVFVGRHIALGLAKREGVSGQYVAK